ncbi:ABC transporter ATP-binding protein [bacterium]|nr:ABC transporter ATP-binding protein [bacterium]
MVSSPALLQVDQLSVSFGRRQHPIRVVSGVSFSVVQGEVVGLVGESGSGKSVTCLGVMGLLAGAQVTGAVTFKGRPVLGLSARDHRSLLGKEMGMIFQSPQASFNPVYTIGTHFIETIQHHHGLSAKEAQSMAVDLLTQVNIADAAQRLNDYPHQFSLGMCQRMMIALTIAMSPSLLIADEPTASLDVTIQAQVMALIQRVKTTHDMGILLVSHDLGLVAQYCDRIMVMYLGELVEAGPTVSVFQSPQHPYTQALLAAIPHPDPTQRVSATPIMGDIPSPQHRPSGCAFHPRCPKRTDRCTHSHPTLSTHRDHQVACFESAYYQPAP